MLELAQARGSCAVMEAFAFFGVIFPSLQVYFQMVKILVIQLARP